MTPLGAYLTMGFLAAPPTPPPGKGAEWGKAAPIGLLILVLLGVALYLLIKSMNRHMRKVSGLTSFDTAAVETPSDSATTGGASSPVGPALTDDMESDVGSGPPKPGARNPE